MDVIYVRRYANSMLLKGLVSKMDTKNILIVGVGGQGTLLTSRIVGHVALNNGYDVKMSEVHGMAQRGGSVVTHVRFGKNVSSPLVEIGKADIILSFEKMEALRWMHYLKEGGIAIVNDFAIDPMPVIMGHTQYPDDIAERLQSTRAKVLIVNALKIAQELGNIRVSNIVLLGHMAKYLSMEPEEWDKAIENLVPPKTIEINKKAFYKGFNE